MRTHQNQIINLISFKSFLFLVAGLFAIAAFGLIFALSSADGGGVVPDEAVLLEEVNTGTLAPTEQHWYKFTPNGANVQQFLTLVFRPDNGLTVNYVSLEIFEEPQLQFYTQGDPSKMFEFGQGQAISRDQDPETGELFWAGFVSSPTTYYILVMNESDFTIDYTLTNAMIGDEVVEPPQAPESPEVQAEAQPEVAAPPIVYKNDNDPGYAEVLKPGKTEGRLTANSTYWYTFSYPKDSDPGQFKDLQYTLFFTPDDGNRKHNVNFQLYPYSEYEIWRRGDIDKLTNFGAGMIVNRDGDDNTGELLWSGNVIKGDKYLLAISNGNDVDIDYHLFDGDITNTYLGAEPAPKPAPVYAKGAAPTTAVPLQLGENKGHLLPGEEAWMKFNITDFDNQAFEEMALTMVATPDDGNRIHNITFDVFAGDDVKYWSPGVNADMHNIGAGSIVYRDNNDVTGERFWKGWVNDGDAYYVQIRNGADVAIDYHMFTGDVYGPELGEKPQPVAQQPADPGTAPYAPVPFELGENKSQLQPGEERWLTFSRSDGAPGTMIDTAFTMIFTPDDGNRIRDVNFELFEGNQIINWAPDNRFNITGFGRGSYVTRDGQESTGELLWKGTVYSGNLYYIRVSNESDVVIDFSLYPQDVINAGLQ